MLSPVLRNCLQIRSISFSLKYFTRQWNRSYSADNKTSPVMAAGEEAGLPLKEVISRITGYVSTKLAESWDNVGLLVEPATKKNVKKIFLTNDLTEDVMDEAVEVKADLIISYHPPIFSPLKSITTGTWKERIIALCLENRIAVYSPHTSVDALHGGVNDWLASAFSPSVSRPIIHSYESKDTYRSVEIISPLSEVEKASKNLEQIQDSILLLIPKVVSSKISVVGVEAKLTVLCSTLVLPEVVSAAETYIGQENKELIRISKCEDVPIAKTGMGRLCLLAEPWHLANVVESVKKLLKLQHVRLALARHGDLKSEVTSIAVCAGSGSSVLKKVKADVYLTGEMSHHDVLDAVHNGTHVILCDHSNTERGYLAVFACKLQGLLDDKIEILLSKRDRDPLEIL